MWPNSYFGNDLFQIANPKFSTLQFVENARQNGIIISQNKTVAAFRAGFNKLVTGQQATNFVDPTFSYPDGEHFMITAIRGFQGINAVLGATAWTAGVTDGLGMNGQFTMTNNGTQELKDMPFTVFQPGTNSPDAGWLILPKPIWWKAQTNMLFQGAWATAPATATLNFRVEFHGLKMI